MKINPIKFKSLTNALYNIILLVSLFRCCHAKQHIIKNKDVNQKVVNCPSGLLFDCYFNYVFRKHYLKNLSY